MEDLDVGHPVDDLEVLDQAVALVMAGVTLRRHHHGHRGPRVPFERDGIQAVVDDGFEQHRAGRTSAA